MMIKYNPPERIQPLLGKQPSIFRFRRALRRADQKVLDHILEMATSPDAPDDPNSYTLVEVILLGMILAEQQQLGQLAGLLAQARLAAGDPPEATLPPVVDLPPD